VFINHSALGDLKETILLNTEYIHKDGRGNPNTSFAVWEGTATEGMLRITRTGPVGDFVEERLVTGNGQFMSFAISAGELSWGRKFERP